MTILNALIDQFGPFTLYVLGFCALSMAIIGTGALCLRAHDYLKSGK